MPALTNYCSFQEWKTTLPKIQICRTTDTEDIALLKPKEEF